MRQPRQLSVIVAIFASALMLATPVAAGKKAEISGTINGIEVIDSSSFEILLTVTPAYGDRVRFLAEVQGSLSPKSRTYITVVCVQGSTVVYQWSGALDFIFPMEDQAGQGLEWPPGTGADCSGTLIYREQKGRKITITFLDQEAFQVMDTTS